MTRASARRASSRSCGSVVGDDAVWLEGRCLSYGGLPLWPFEEMLRAWLGIAEAEPEIAVRTKARARLGDPLGRPTAGRRSPRWVGCSGSGSTRSRRRMRPASDAPETMRRAFRHVDRGARPNRARRRRRRGPALGAPRGPRARRAPARRDRSCGRPARRDDATRSRPRRQPGFRVRALGDFAHRTIELRLGPLDRGRAGARSPRSLAQGQLDDETVAVGRRPQRGQPALPRGARAVAARGRGVCSVAARGR